MHLKTSIKLWKDGLCFLHVNKLTTPVTGFRTPKKSGSAPGVTEVQLAMRAGVSLGESFIVFYLIACAAAAASFARASSQATISFFAST